MSPTSGAAGERTTYDALAWFLNISTSVLIVFVNKVLMDPRRGYGFTFATTLCAFHFLSAAVSMRAAEALGWTEAAELPFAVAAQFALIANVSIASLNVSLLVNSVGFYQIAKLLIIPFVCGVEAVWMRRRFTPPVLVAIATVVSGVAIVTVSDMAVRPLGVVVAAVSVVSSGMQQVLCGRIQRTHNLASHQLLANTAPLQGAMLLALGPAVDRLVSGNWVTHAGLSARGLAVLALSCTVSVGVNVSQFMCLGRFSAVTFQVLGHAKTLLVLVASTVLLHEPMSGRKAFGMALAVAGMIAYGYYNSAKTTPAGGAAAAAGRVVSASRSMQRASGGSVAAPLLGSQPRQGGDAGGAASGDGGGAAALRAAEKRGAGLSTPTITVLARA